MINAIYGMYCSKLYCTLLFNPQYVYATLKMYIIKTLLLCIILLNVVALNKLDC
jgi:hypothetical protein